MADDKKPEKKAKKQQALRISSKTDSLRRAGLAFTKEPTAIPLANLKKEQVAALKAERMLVVEEVEIDTAAEGEGE